MGLEGLLDLLLHSFVKDVQEQYNKQVDDALYHGDALHEAGRAFPGPVRRCLWKNSSWIWHNFLNMFVVSRDGLPLWLSGRTCHKQETRVQSLGWEDTSAVLQNGQPTFCVWETLMDRRACSL